jgi:TetR/AcrR family transcriptional regulator
MARLQDKNAEQAPAGRSAENLRTRRWNRRRREIILTAETVFAELGFGAATLEEVAARLDLRRASLAYYFDDKEALFDSVFHEILLELQERLQPAFDQDDPLTGIESMTSLWVDFLQERPDAGRVLLRQMVDGLSPRSESTRGSFFDLLRSTTELIDRGVRRGQFKALDAGQYGAMIAGTSLLWVSSRETLSRGFGFDPLAPEQMENLRHRLVQLTRQLLEART